MAMINCPECGKEISNKADACPYCGCHSADVQESENVNDTTKFIVSLCLCVFGMALAFLINGGFLLIIPFILLVISLVLGIKCEKKLATLCVVVSGFGVALIILEFIKVWILFR